MKAILFTRRGRHDYARRRTRAFTLVELLVVVSIIALLISILLPSLKKAREQARIVKCLAHMRGTGTAAMVFAGEHGNRVQLVASEGNVEAADPTRTRYAYGSGDELLAWPAALAQVTATGFEENWNWGVRAASYEEAKANEKHIDESLKLFSCPSDPVILSSAFFPRHEPSLYGEGLRGTSDPPISPKDKMSYWGRLSFGINEDIAGGDGADLDFWPSCWRSVRDQGGGWEECNGGVMYGPSSPCFRGAGQRLRGSLDKIFAPGLVGLIFETGPENAQQAASPTYASQYANLVNSTARQAFPDRSGPYLGDAQQSHPWRIPTKRHPNGALNVVFADMHGQTVRAVKHEYNSEVRETLPSRYGPRVRVSPYNPHGLGTD